jgi:hypothetical protein
MMNCGMMFCHIVAVVLFAWGPVVLKLSSTFSVAEPMVLHVHCFQFLDGPEGRPNNLPQPAWRLAELFFRSDMSWSRADLCANSYVISTHFSFLSKLPPCTHYISYVGIERIIYNLLFRIIRTMLFVELGPTGFPMMAFFRTFSTQ